MFSLRSRSVSVLSISSRLFAETVTKVISVVAIFAGGLSRVTQSAIPFTFDNSSKTPASFALALFASSWCYDGWDQANYIAKDVAPGKLPQIIRYSMGTVVLLFLFANISFFLVVPFELATTNPIGLQFGRELFGSVGAAVMSVRHPLSLRAVQDSLMSCVGRRRCIMSRRPQFVTLHLESTSSRGGRTEVPPRHLFPF